MLLSILHTLLISYTYTHFEELIASTFFLGWSSIQMSICISSIGSYRQESIYQFLTESHAFWTFCHLLIAVFLLEANSTAHMISLESSGIKMCQANKELLYKLIKLKHSDWNGLRDNQWSSFTSRGNYCYLGGWQAVTLLAWTAAEGNGCICFSEILSRWEVISREGRIKNLLEKDH